MIEKFVRVDTIHDKSSLEISDATRVIPVSHGAFWIVIEIEILDYDWLSPSACEKGLIKIGPSQDRNRPYDVSITHYPDNANE